MTYVEYLHIINSSDISVIYIYVRDDGRRRFVEERGVEKMKIDRTLLSGSSAMLVLKLLTERDMYGYQITEELAARSQNVFEMKSGTLYPLLHTLEQKGWVTAYEQMEGGRERRYYAITDAGKRQHEEKREEWECYTTAVSRVLGGA